MYFPRKIPLPPSPLPARRPPRKLWAFPRGPTVNFPSESADTMLAQMAQEGQAVLAVPQGRREISKIKYSHDAMIDMMIADPRVTQSQLAAYFGRTPSWISIVVNSDVFKARLAARKAELVDPEISLTMRERIEALTTQSLKILQEKLAKPADQVPDNLAVKALEMGSKALGLGGNAAPQVLVTSEERVSRLAHRLLALQGGVVSAPLEQAPAGSASGDVVDVASREVGQ